MNVADQSAHWNSVSSSWSFLGPPLKPSPEDIQVILEVVARHRLERGGGRYRVVLWGVTPELALMEWPAETDLLAIDHAPQMLESVWPGDVPGFRKATCGEWADTLRLAGGGGLDLIIGDGSLSCVGYPGQYRELASVAAESLRARGLVILRLHAAVEVREKPEQVVEDLLNLQIGNFHVFKFRLAMALQESPEDGVELAEVWSYWKTLEIDEESLSRRTGWDPRVIRTIHLYRGKRDRYSFPTVSEQLRALEPQLEVVEVRIPQYEMGERRPIVVLSKRERACGAEGDTADAGRESD